MKNFLKNAVFLIACLAVGFGIAKGFLYIKAHWGNQDFSHSEPVLVTGVGDAPARRGFLLTTVPTGDALGTLLEDWRRQFATTVGVRYGVGDLAGLVKAAHGKGLSVVLLPPAKYGSTNPYPQALTEVAAEAAKARVDVFCMSWLNVDPDPAYWREQVKGVRGVYKGKLILAAKWEVLPAVSCWDVADYMGVTDPTFALRLPHASDKVKMEDFRVAWSATIGAVEALARHYGKKVAILGAEVPVNPGFKMFVPGTHYEMPENRELQAMIYQGLLVETKGRAEVTDLLLLSWGDRNGVEKVSGLMKAVADAWDPKKPAAKVAETFPAEVGDPFEEGKGEEKAE